VFGASPDKFCVVALLFHKKEYGAVPFVIDKVIDPLLPPDAFTLDMQMCRRALGLRAGCSAALAHIRCCHI
jgi:hypothetical protein